MVRLIGGHIRLYPVDQMLVGRSQVRRRGIRSVVSVSRCRRPRMKIGCAGKRLADDSRTHDLAVLHNQLAVGLVLEQHLRQSSDHQRIDDP